MECERELTEKHIILRRGFAILCRKNRWVETPNGMKRVMQGLCEEIERKTSVFREERVWLTPKAQEANSNGRRIR